MDLEDGNKGSKLSDIVDGSGEIKQSETPLKVPDGTEKSKQSKTAAEAPDGTGEIEQPKTPVEVPDGTGKTPKVPDKSEESKQSETAPKVPDKSEESKQSETPPKVNDVSREIKQSETTTKVSDSGENAQREAPPNVNDGSGESKQSETVSKVNDGSGGNKHLSSPPQVVEATAKGTLPKVNDASGASKPPSSPPLPSKVEDATAKGGHQSALSGTIPKVNDGSGASKYPSSPPFQSKVIETTAKVRHTRESSDRLLSFTSSSSSGSDTSFNDLFQVDASRFSTSSTHIPPLPRDYGQGSPYRSSTSCMSNAGNGLPKESPPAIQMTDRYGGYDPSRIPSSVFDTSNHSNKEMEWSVASNDSLFSLHLGNNSFSRDHIVMLNDFGSTKSGEFIGISPRTPPPIVEEGMNRIEEGRESSAEELADVNIKDTEHASTENHSEGRKVQRPTITGTKSPSLGFSQRSDASGFSANSARSFAFPILTDGTKNSLKLPQDSEPKHLEPSPARMPKKSSKKKSRWVPCFSWCRGGCGGCSCRRSCSCSSCFRRICCCC